ncbi:MAG TPA: glutaminase [Albitalea sp.]|uniref:glutaminase n=1 Tax=Piscinibacter sp. TaxID=1903157 RepID=UPI002ED5C469
MTLANTSSVGATRQPAAGATRPPGPRITHSAGAQRIDPQEGPAAVSAPHAAGLHTSEPVELFKVQTVRGVRVLVNKALLDNFLYSNLAPDGRGHQAEGIPGLNQHPDRHSMTVMNLETGEMVTGAITTKAEPGQLIPESVDENNLEDFSIQSISKSFVHAYLITLAGISELDEMEPYAGPEGRLADRDNLGIRVLNGDFDFEASGQPYNARDPSAGREKLFNLHNNDGALKAWGRVIEYTPKGEDPFTGFMDFVKRLSGRSDLRFNEKMAQGEFEFEPNNNRLILKNLESTGAARVSTEDILKAYCKACAIEMNTKDLTRSMASLMTGVDAAGNRFYSTDAAKHVDRAHVISGHYTRSGGKLIKEGYAGKSGVDGASIFVFRDDRNVVGAIHTNLLDNDGNTLEGSKSVNDAGRMQLVFPEEAAAEARKNPVRRGLAKAVPFQSSGAGKALSAALKKKGNPPLDAALGEVRFKKPAKLLDKALLGEMTSDSLKKLRAVVAKRSDKKGMYLKPMRDSVSLRTKGRGGELVLEAKTIHGVMKEYHLVPDEQGLAKIVVSPERKPIAPKRVTTLEHLPPERRKSVAPTATSGTHGNPPDPDIPEVK